LRKDGTKPKLLILKGLAPQAGFEPATLRLTAKHAGSSASLKPETW
jgi:hypothetical protein